MRIEIEELTFTCIIGLLDFERVQEQKVIVNVYIDYKYTENYFINYADVSNTIKQTLKVNKFELLEDALVNLKNQIVNEYKNIEELYIKISKPDILKDCVVSLSNKWVM